MRALLPLVLLPLLVSACGTGTVENAQPAAQEEQPLKNSGNSGGLGTTGSASSTTTGGGATTGNTVPSAGSTTTGGGSSTSTTTGVGGSTSTSTTTGVGGSTSTSTTTGGGSSTSTGGGTAGTATLQGTVAGYGFTPQSAIFAMGSDANGNPELQVKLSDQPNDCSLVGQRVHHVGANALWLRGVGGPFPGMFQLQPSGGSSATYYSLGSACTTQLGDNQSGAFSGTLTFTTVTGNTAVGTFSATMGSQGDAISGSFHAVACPALAAFINQPDQPQTCQ